MDDARTPTPHEDPLDGGAQPEAEMPTDPGEDEGATTFEDPDQHELLDGEEEPEDDLSARLGEGMAEREDQHRISRRALVLAVAGLLAGLAAALTLLYLMLPEPATVPDVRPNLRTSAGKAQQDLVDVHRQQLEDLVRDPAKAGQPVVAVVCGLEKGDAPRKQRCELRATSYVDAGQAGAAADVPAKACTSSRSELEDFAPMVTRGGACDVPAPFTWWQQEGRPEIDGSAGWYLRGKAPESVGEGTLAVTTRHDLGTYEIGDCPASGCGIGQIQLPQVDFRSDGKR